MSVPYLFKHVPVFPQLFYRSSMEPLLARLSELSPPQVETIVRAGFDLLPADTKAALWTAFGPPGTAQVFDIDQKSPPQCGVKRPAAPKAEVCQELMYQSVRFVMWF